MVKNIDSDRVRIYNYAKLINPQMIHFGKHVIIDDFVLIYAKKKIALGNYVHIACFSSLTGGEEIVVGDYCAISQGCRILTATDDFIDWGFGNSTVPEKYRNTKRAPITIGKFCIIGANSVVLPGVNIGEGVTVGACSVVTKDLAPWGVYIGNRRYKERNQKAVMKNYQLFLKENKRKP